MSSIEDPAKLKVVELRAELTARGLDSKGVKATLVKRLKGALEKEYDAELPNTTITDTSTEDCNLSADENDPLAEGASPVEEIIVPPDSPTPPLEPKPNVTLPTSPAKVPVIQEPVKAPTPVKAADDVVTPAKGPAAAIESPVKAPAAAAVSPVKSPAAVVSPDKVEQKIVREEVKVAKEDAVAVTAVIKEAGPQQKTAEEGDLEEESSSNEQMEVDNTATDKATAESSEDVKSNGNKSDNAPVVKKRERKNRWAESEVTADDSSMAEDASVTGADAAPAVTAVPMAEDGAAAAEADATVKRKRSVSPVPAPVQQLQKRSRSPIREDNPEQDENVVQLNW